MIEIKHVSKSFGEIAAVTDINLTLQERSVFGMLGTNGAGKSTLLRMMTGVLKPDGGEILIDDGSKWVCVFTFFDKNRSVSCPAGKTEKDILACFL